MPRAERAQVAVELADVLARVAEAQIPVRRDGAAQQEHRLVVNSVEHVAAAAPRSPSSGSAVYTPSARLITAKGEPSGRARKVKVPAWEILSERLPRSTVRGARRRLPRGGRGFPGAGHQRPWRR